MHRKLRCISPKKRLVNRNLTFREMESNSQLANDRFLVNNYFGRTGTLSATRGRKYSWAEGSYDPIMRMCVALKHLHKSGNLFCEEYGVDISECGNSCS